MKPDRHTDENLGDVLDEGYRAHQREVAVKNLGERTHLTLGQISKLCENPKHGEIVATITLQELLDIKLKDVTEEPAAAPPKAKKAAKKKTAKKAAKKTTAKKTTAKKGAKADKGKPKPRLDYDVGMKEVLACLKAAKEPLGRSAIEKATGFTGVQVRAFAKKLKASGKINILGEGGRSTKYEAA